MNARIVQSIIAAGLQHPDLLSKWQGNPSFLRNNGIDPAQLDLEALKKFSGLTIKVRHNALRLDFPLSFRLMAISGLDIGIFSAYAVTQSSQGRRYAATSEGRAIDFITFLEQWLDLKTKSHSLLWDLIRHEQAIAQLKRLAGKIEMGPLKIGSRMKSRITSRSRPEVQGEIILHAMNSDPQAIESHIFERPPRLEQIKLCSSYRCYWLPPSGDEVQILGLDEFAYHALGMIDGLISVGELSGAFGGAARPSKLFFSLLAELASTGLLEFKSNRGVN